MNELQSSQKPEETVSATPAPETASPEPANEVNAEEAQADAANPASPGVSNMEPALDEADPEDPENASAEEEGPDEFAEMLESSLSQIKKYRTGDIISARVVALESEWALLDFGEKSEGVIALTEFTDNKGKVHLNVGDELAVMVTGRDDETGQLTVSHKRAQERVGWESALASSKNGAAVKGRVIRVVNKGVIVNIGIDAFMPGSQIDVRPVKNMEEWIGRDVEVCVLDCDPKNRKCIVSRRKVEDSRRQEAASELLDSLKAGDERLVVVKKIMDFGAFCDLGGIDGLIPRSELSWDVNPNPADILKVGDDLKVKIIDINLEKRKIALSRKQMRPDPWESITAEYEAGRTVKGVVVHVTAFEAFVSIEEGVTGRVHHEDLTWAKGRVKVNDHLKVGDPVRCLVLDIDHKRRRLKLGVKQLEANPWQTIEDDFPIKSTVTGEIVSLTNFGAFMRLNEFIDGLIHVTDITWDRSIRDPKQALKVGDTVEAMVLSIDKEKQKINLGLKQLEESPFVAYTRLHKPGSLVEGKVVKLLDFAVVLELASGVEGFIHVSQLSDERVEKPTDMVKEGDLLQAQISKIDNKRRRVELSRRAMIREQERKEIEHYAQGAQPAGQTFAELFDGLNIQTVDGAQPAPKAVKEEPAPAPKPEPELAETEPPTTSIYAPKQADAAPVLQETGPAQEATASATKAPAPAVEDAAAPQDLLSFASATEEATPVTAEDDTQPSLPLETNETETADSEEEKQPEA
ncbi:30S ribosomal protein S1 [Candidatus Sumerlaeota bacterium]|nr:30S ribosomal protein S1 [Candidatus Sumerlaeota bacterium]